VVVFRRRTPFVLSVSIVPFTRYNLLSNRFDNRLYRVNGVYKLPHADTSAEARSISGWALHKATKLAHPREHARPLSSDSLKTRSTGTMHTSAKARLTSVALGSGSVFGSPPKFNHLFIGPLSTFPENFMQIRSKAFAQSW